MIQAIFTKDNDNFIRSIKITGHADSGEYGYDIVCASVSTLSLNFINSVTVLTDHSLSYDLNDKEGGYISIEMSPTTLSPTTYHNIQLLSESFLIGMTNLSENAADFVKTKVITEN